MKQPKTKKEFVARLVKLFDHESGFQEYIFTTLIGEQAYNEFYDNEDEIYNELMRCNLKSLEKAWNASSHIM